MGWARALVELVVAGGCRFVCLGPEVFLLLAVGLLSGVEGPCRSIIEAGCGFQC